MKILLISFYFPPYNNIGSVRVGKTAKYLLAAGHDVRVVTAKDQLIPVALTLEIPSERVIYTHWTNVRRPAELFARKQVQNTAPTRPTIGYAPPKRAITSALWSAFKSVVYFPDMHIGWFRPARRACLELAENWTPDVIYASAVPYTALMIARSVAKKLQIPWVAELRDLWTDNHFYEYPFWRRWLDRKLEKSVLNSAAGFVTVSEPLAETLRTRYSQPITVATNGFDPGDYPASVSFNQDGKLRIAYTGGLHQCNYDLTPLFQALRLLGPMEDRIEVSFYGRPADLAVVDSAAKINGVSGFLRLHSAVSHRESSRVQCEADILLFLIWNDVAQGRGVYSGKFFEYIGSRRPILAVGQSNNVAAEYMQKHNLGFVSQDATAIAAKLRAWMDQKLAQGKIAAEPPGIGAEFSREAQTQVIADALVRTVQLPGPQNLKGGARA